MDKKTEVRFWAKVDKRGHGQCWPWGPCMKIILALPVLVLLAGCGTLSDVLGGGDPTAYARGVPVACEAKLTEIEGLGGDVTAIRIARTAKNGAIAVIPIAVAASFIPPAWGFAPPALVAFRLDDAGRQKRIDFLIERYYEQGCNPLE